MLNSGQMQKFYRREFMSNFEKFALKQQRSFSHPMASITKGNSINFNAVAIRQYIKHYSYVIFYYDRKNQLIGMKLTEKDAPEAYRIRKGTRDNLCSVSAISFLKHYKINHKKTLAYPLELNEQEEMLIIDLKEHKEKIENKEGKSDKSSKSSDSH